MADKIISLKINVKLIDKARLFTSAKTGAVYLDATILWNDEQDQYNNNGPIVQQVSKEEREKGIKGAILGNAKLISAAPAASKQPTETIQVEIADLEVKDDLPF